MAANPGIGMLGGRRSLAAMDVYSSARLHSLLVSLGLSLRGRWGQRRGEKSEHQLQEIFAQAGTNAPRSTATSRKTSRTHFSSKKFPNFFRFQSAREKTLLLATPLSSEWTRPLHAHTAEVGSSHVGLGGSQPPPSFYSQSVGNLSAERTRCLGLGFAARVRASEEERGSSLIGDRERA